MAPQQSSFNLEEIKTKICLIGAPGAIQNTHDQEHSTSKVFGDSNDRPVDGTFSSSGSATIYSTGTLYCTIFLIYILHNNLSFQLVRHKQYYAASKCVFCHVHLQGAVQGIVMFPRTNVKQTGLPWKLELWDPKMGVFLKTEGTTPCTHCFKQEPSS
jgi:hypothetical protein